ncbi:hypothetical protein SCHPADRAFT_245618 [Schizopora paradoxa]|uniref:Uncharacterized protein n=1 Tax=Schizopora paradoxa TaxID=27342 RepID=A0A0H2SFI7_9AGAM|nr:hypothetical protein SCHPADRAFT_245618 [Schizopora paradoxa]
MAYSFLCLVRRISSLFRFFHHLSIYSALHPSSFQVPFRFVVQSRHISSCQLRLAHRSSLFALHFFLQYSFKLSFFYTVIFPIRPIRKPLITQPLANKDVVPIEKPDAMSLSAMCARTLYAHDHTAGVRADMTARARAMRVKNLSVYGKRFSIFWTSFNRQLLSSVIRDLDA